MKMRTIFGIVAATILQTSAALADKYDDLVAKGYRWVTTDGPFACTSKEASQRLAKDQSEENRLRMVSQGGVYYAVHPRFGTAGISDSWFCALGSRFLAWGSVRSVLGLGDDRRTVVA